uniref:Uncharacterized protein n=1 Tax=Cacopsylla melanoneura TaxID=428564 RepID=A0A8D9F1X4_9HEMI
MKDIAGQSSPHRGENNSTHLNCWELILGDGEDIGAGADVIVRPPGEHREGDGETATIRQHGNDADVFHLALLLQHLVHMVVVFLFEMFIVRVLVIILLFGFIAFIVCFIGWFG